jgi:hypothetical protein
LHAVVLRDRHVLALDEPVPIEAEDWLIRLFLHPVVVESTLVAAVVQELAILIVLAVPEAMDPARFTLTPPTLEVEVTVTGVSGAMNS